MPGYFAIKQVSKFEKQAKNRSFNWKNKPNMCTQENSTKQKISKKIK